jgi:uncharacterized membrane protein
MDLMAEILVDVPIDATFAYYADQARLQEWVPGGGISEFTPLTPSPKKPGSRYRMGYKSLGVTFSLIAELTVLERNRMSVMEQITGDYKAFRYEMHFTAATDKSTGLKMRISATLPWGILGTLADWISRPLVQRDISRALERLKMGIESLDRRSQCAEQPFTSSQSRIFDSRSNLP